MNIIRKSVIHYSRHPGDFVCDLIGAAALFVIVFGGLLVAVVVG